MPMPEKQPGLQLSPDQSRTLRLLRAGVCVTIITPLLFLGFVAQKRYQQIWNEQVGNAERITHIASEHALKLFDTNQVLLQRLSDMVENKSDADITANEPQLHEKVKRMVAGLPQVQSVWVMDAAGHPLLTDRFSPSPRELDLSDRDSFIAHRNGHRDLYITGALLGKKTKDVFFDLTRRRETAEGEFAGTVQVSLYPKYLVKFYEGVVPSGASMVIAMTKSDGTFIARWPQIAEVGSRISAKSKLVQAMAQDLPSGTIPVTSTIDGTEREVSFRKVGNYPVYVSVGIAHRDIRSVWTDEMLRFLGLALPIMAVIGILGFWLVRRTREQLELSNALYAEVVQREEMERALLQAQKMEALGHLTSGVAHDVNNLLMTIDMSTHVLGEKVPELRGNDRLKAIQRAVDTGAKLTRQLLSFSRRQVLAPSAIELQETLPAILDMCKPVLGRSYEVRLTIDPATPAIQIDLAELELAMLNLAINAKHAMPNGGSFEVIVRPGVERTGKECVELLVRDTGTGIDPVILDKVFEPFFTTRASGEGTGLGLSQVKAMCERAGGSVYLSTELGKGTTVCMVFPASEILLPPSGVAAPFSSPIALRVLLVEDNEEIAKATRLALESLGCSVLYCSRGDDALAALESRTTEVDFVLSDVQMPGGTNGIELAKHARHHFPDIPVVLMTGYTEHVGEAESLGIHILPKPFGIPALRDALSHTVRVEGVSP